MKSINFFIIVFVGLLNFSLSAQETLYFDANWNSISKDKATYYRPQPKILKNGFWIVDYFIDGSKQMEGFSLNDVPNNEKFHGLVKYFFQDGTLFQEIYFKEGKINGIRKVFFESGKIKTKTVYVNDKKVGKHYEYYQTGELLSKGNFVNNFKEGTWKMFYKNGKIKQRGDYTQDKKTGTWKIFYRNQSKK